MEEVILPVVAIIALLIASYSDLRTREVPDWLTYGLLFSALGVRTIFSIELGWKILLQGVIGFALLFVVGYLFYIVSQWGGGDAKLLMAMGAVIGFSVPLNPASLNLLWYFLLLLLLGSIYGLIWMVVVALIKRKIMFPKFVQKVSGNSTYHIIMAILTLCFALLTFYNTLFWPLILFPMPLFYLLLLVTTVEDVNFYKKIDPKKLTEGDWLAEDVKVNGKMIMEKTTLEKSDIKKLQKHSIKVLIKEGIPFIPSFLFAYVAFLFMDKILILIGLV